MRAERVCSECGASLEHRAPSAVTCSPRCRDRRRRRRQRAGFVGNEAESAALVSVAQILGREHGDAVAKAMNEELRPIVREAIDEDVLQAIGKLVKLTPAAVNVLEEQMQTGTPSQQAHAAGLVMKYTVGHPALVRPQESNPPALQVNFALPRPDDGPERTHVDASCDEEIETKVCDMCGVPKTLSEFVGASDRCTVCFDEMRRKVMEHVE